MILLPVQARCMVSLAPGQALTQVATIPDRAGPQHEACMHVMCQRWNSPCLIVSADTCDQERGACDKQATGIRDDLLDVETWIYLHMHMPHMLGVMMDMQLHVSEEIDRWSSPPAVSEMLQPLFQAAVCNMVPPSKQHRRLMVATAPEEACDGTGSLDGWAADCSQQEQNVTVASSWQATCRSRSMLGMYMRCSPKGRVV